MSKTPLSKGTWLLFLGTAVSALSTGCGSGGTEAPVAAPCDYEQLRIAPRGAVGATGHMGLTVLIDNPAAETCELSGYPKLRLLDGDDQTMSSVVEGQGALGLVAMAWARSAG